MSYAIQEEEEEEIHANFDLTGLPADDVLYREHKNPFAIGGETMICLSKNCPKDRKSGFHIKDWDQLKGTIYKHHAKHHPESPIMVLGNMELYIKYSWRWVSFPVQQFAKWFRKGKNIESLEEWTKPHWRWEKYFQESLPTEVVYADFLLSQIKALVRGDQKGLHGDFQRKLRAAFQVVEQMDSVGEGLLELIDAASIIKDDKDLQDLMVTSLAELTCVLLQKCETNTTPLPQYYIDYERKAMWGSSVERRIVFARMLKIVVLEQSIDSKLTYFNFAKALKTMKKYSNNTVLRRISETNQAFNARFANFEEEVKDRAHSSTK